MSAILNGVRFEVFPVVAMKNAVFWDVVSYGFCKNRLFVRTYRLHQYLLRLLVTADVVPSSPILVVLIVEKIRSSENVGFYKTHTA
jgi:hypothetical protein